MSTAGPVRALGVAGAGTMGAGIAQVACTGGFETYLHDPFPAALERGLSAVRAGLEKAIELAEVVARRPPIAVRLGKQAVLAADEMALSAGLDHERRLYELAMATEDRVEGMTAFIEKRRPQFRGR